jgi:hypothetical protein
MLNNDAKHEISIAVPKIHSMETRSNLSKALEGPDVELAYIANLSNPNSMLRRISI